MPDSSRIGMLTAFISGASASSLRSLRASAYEAADSVRAIRPSSANASARSPTRTVSPNGKATRISRIAWTSSVTTSRSDRPSSSDSRLTGVTRIRSMTPARSSAIRPNPTNSVPNMASCTSRPGTKNLYASALLIRSAFFSSGPNSSRKYSGCIRPTTTQTGLRSTSVICRVNTIQVSRTSPISGSFGALAQGSAGLGQEHVVEAGPVQLDRAERDAGGVEGAQDVRDGGGAGVDVQPQAVLERLQPVHVRLGFEQRRGLRRGAGQPDRHDVTGDLALEVAGGALGDDPPVVHDRDAVAEGVRLFQVVRRNEDRHPLGAQPPHLVPHVGAALRVEPGGRLVEEDDPRLVDDAERDVDAPALAAGVGLARPVGERLQLERLDRALGTASGLGLVDA